MCQYFWHTCFFLFLNEGCNKSLMFVIYQHLNTSCFLLKTSGKQKRVALQIISLLHRLSLSPLGQTGPPGLFPLEGKGSACWKMTTWSCPQLHYMLRAKRSGSEKRNQEFHRRLLRIRHVFFAFAWLLKTMTFCCSDFAFNRRRGSENNPERAVFVQYMDTVKSPLAACLCMKMTSGGALLSTQSGALCQSAIELGHWKWKRTKTCVCVRVRETESMAEQTMSKYGRRGVTKGYSYHLCIHWQ